MDVAPLPAIGGESEKGMVNLIEVIEYGLDDEPRSLDPEKRQTRSDAAMEVNKTDGDKAVTEDQKEDDDEDADYDEEEDDNDDDEEEEDDDGDEDDDEEDEGEDDNGGEDGDEGDQENKPKFFLQDLKLFDCSNCHKRLFNTVYMCENEHIACHSCFSSSSSKCKSCAPSASFKRCQILEKIIQLVEGSSNI